MWSQNSLMQQITNQFALKCYKHLKFAQWFQPDTLTTLSTMSKKHKKKFIKTLTKIWG